MESIETVSIARPGATSAEAGSSADSVVVRRVRAGGRDDFSLLVIRHQKAVFATVWRIVRSREAAEDITQEAFIRAWRRLSEFDDSRPFRPWLIRIALNLAVSYMRREARIVPLDDEVVGRMPAQEESSRETVVRAEIAGQLRQAVDGLAPESNAIVSMFYHDEMSITEIARVIGKKPGAVKVALHRARLRLRQAVFGGGSEGASK